MDVKTPDDVQSLYSTLKAEVSSVIAKKFPETFLNFYRKNSVWNFPNGPMNITLKSFNI